MAEVARILGYPNLSPQSSLQPHYPNFSSQCAMWQPYAFLLNRLAACSSDDEVQMLGAESALFGSKFVPSSVTLTFMLTGGGVTAGAIYKMNVGNVSFAYQAQPSDTVASIAAQFATQIEDDPTPAHSLCPTRSPPHSPSTISPISGRTATASCASRRRTTPTSRCHSEAAPALS